MTNGCLACESSSAWITRQPCTCCMHLVPTSCTRVGKNLIKMNTTALFLANGHGFAIGSGDSLPSEKDADAKAMVLANQTAPASWRQISMKLCRSHLLRSDDAICSFCCCSRGVVYNSACCSLQLTVRQRCSSDSV